MIPSAGTASAERARSIKRSMTDKAPLHFCTSDLGQKALSHQSWTGSHSVSIGKEARRVEFQKEHEWRKSVMERAGPAAKLEWW